MTLTYDEKAQAYVCPIHGPQEMPGRVICWDCGGEGGRDAYEDDPINYSMGEAWVVCSTCHGDGDWIVCLECNRDNPDVEVL